MPDTWQYVTPTREWITLTAGEIAGGVSAAAVMRAMVNNSEFIREALLGENTTCSTVPHVHDGTLTPFLEIGTFGRNTLTNSAPSSDERADYGDWWPKPKYHKKKPPHVVPGPGGLYFDGRKNVHVWTMPTTRADVSRMIFGGGAACNFSAFVKRTGTATQGEISFGLSTSNGWLEGCRFAVDYTDLTTSFKRFWGTAIVAPELTEGGVTMSDEDAPELEQLNGPRFEVRVTDDFDCGVQASAFQMTVGERLHWYMPSRMDAHGNGSHHDDWNGYGLLGVPAWETSVAFTNAVRLYGV